MLGIIGESKPSDRIIKICGKMELLPSIKLMSMLREAPTEKSI